MALRLGHPLIMIATSFGKLTKVSSQMAVDGLDELGEVVARGDWSAYATGSPAMSGQTGSSHLWATPRLLISRW